MYWALKLTTDTKDKLILMLPEKVIIPANWTRHLDHITLIHSKNVTREVWDAAFLILDNFICPKSEFRITGYAKNDSVIALRVDTRSMNHQSHITVATAPGHKPVESNDIKDDEWVEVWCPEKFVGYLVCEQ